ncbi:hypothetical protein Cch01nite_18150 [Cellulomonas chitinilytica]|uniref:Uncharacterized protein n=1 Tax=Cellulomonas chitinilytica TaxID=398759 RepID=A0A919P3T5_9CELL|nr:hypothetical protein [Cellulomonas chitinilytica]GIG21091.1 hypothetical protein Cch01nite_18150 [Cellulomonas chitinilytica]
MRHLSTAVRRAAGCLAALAAVVALAAPPASASSDRDIAIRGLAQCDAVAGQWVVTWEVTNHADVTGTIGNVRAYPASRPLVGLPSRIQPGETVRGEQRLLASEYSGEILFDVNWDDGPVTYDHHWPIYIYLYCGG